jgi:uncharacterized protein (TIGR02246 family)
MQDTSSTSGPVPGARVTLASLAFLIAACGPSPTQQPEADPALGVAQAAIPAQAVESDIIDLLDRWTAAWSAKDATAFAAVYAVDADFVNPLGAVVPGRTAIEATHAFLFGAFFAGSEQTWEMRRLVPLTGSLALVDLNVELAGFQGVPPGLPVSPDGIVRTRTRLTVGRTGGSWEIQSQQLTAYVP